MKVFKGHDGTQHSYLMKNTARACVSLALSLSPVILSSQMEYGVDSIAIRSTMYYPAVPAMGYIYIVKRTPSVIHRVFVENCVEC